MASSAAIAGADALINIKVNFDGVTRRFKLPLRDVGANTFEIKLRACLQIPEDTNAVVERYSDSAGSYVTLHQTNIAVYKQLYRAAKAKQKLKLRVTSRPTEPEPVKAIVAPKPATVEDDSEEVPTVSEPEAENVVVEEKMKNETTELSLNDIPPVPVTASEAVETVVAPRTGQDFPSFVKQWRARGNPRIHLRRDLNGTEVIDFLGQTATSEDVVTSDSPEGSTSSTMADDHSPTTMADLMRVACERELAIVKKREERANTVKEIMARSAARSKTEVGPLQPSKATAEAEETKTESHATEPVVQQECMKKPFTVCCNSCDRAVPEAHFHCSICDEGDFDLCQECVDRGISCYGVGHWLIKRTVVNGDIKCSSTQIAPKAVKSTTKVSSSLPSPPLASQHDWVPHSITRTCNCCVQEYQEAEFVHCTSCDDYDLCKSCFAKDRHGHHPKHGFTAAAKGTVFDQHVSARLTPGRNILHNAICDGCDKYVRGVRHKCLDCPDWDYCADCVSDASFIHPNHRFVAIYEPIADRPLRTASRAIHHYGISCDGPLCSSRKGSPKYIVGERYKCAVCHDTDFCASCEASPANRHNKTHPLIKFKTPVRHVSVTTTGEHEDGQRLPAMGDKCPRSHPAAQSTDKPAPAVEQIAATLVQTVVDVQPTEEAEVMPASQARFDDEIEHIETELEAPAPVDPVVPLHASPASDLVATFKWDTIRDGSVLPPNHTFEQTWVLRNEGKTPWPAGCAVKFVGGDYMGAVDPAHPAGIHELVSASESTVCYNALNPGQGFPFTVLMRTPDREGKVISYWRLTTPDGVKFGHKLWCDVTVETPPKTEHIEDVDVSAPVQSEVDEEILPAAISESRMIIPKLDHESPSASVHQSRSETESEAETETETVAPSSANDDEFEDCGAQDDWAEDSDNGFMTDEEYDILDASDEEFLFEQQKKLPKN